MDNTISSNSRQKQIIYLLSKNTVMTIKDLADVLKVSPVTIRRDLEYLDSINFITKFHGSVALLKTDIPQTSFMMSIEEHRREKYAIAKAAASLIQPQNVISIDSGSTTYSLADQIPIDYSLKIITNSLISALKFSQNPKMEVIQVGGVIHFDTSSSTDFLATEFLRKFNTDIAFITANAFQIPLGAYDSIVSLVAIKQVYMEISRRVVLMLDSSKFSKRSMHLSVPLNKINTIITDEKTPQDIISFLIDLKKELIIVDTETATTIQHYNKI